MRTIEKIMILLIIIIIAIIAYIIIKEKTTTPYEKECLEWVNEKYKFSKAVETGNEKLCPGEYCIAAIRKNTSYCDIGDEVEIVVTGVCGSKPFEGTDTIRVTDTGKNK